MQGEDIIYAARILEPTLHEIRDEMKKVTAHLNNLVLILAHTKNGGEPLDG